MPHRCLATLTPEQRFVGATVVFTGQVGNQVDAFDLRGSLSGRVRKTAWELYDLSEDVAETNNLAKDHPDVLEQLIERWQTMNNEMIEPLF